MIVIKALFYNCYKLSFVFAFLLLFGIAYSYSVKSLQIDFARTIISKTGKHESSGTIYYSEDGLFKLKITNPVSQWLMFNKDSYDIYYQRACCRINSNFQAESPVLCQSLYHTGNRFYHNYGIAEVCRRSSAGHE